MAAAADRCEHVVLPAESHGGLDVLDVRGVRDQARPLVDHAVVDFAGLVVTGIARLYELTAQARLERSDVVAGRHRVLPGRVDHRMEAGRPAVRQAGRHSVC